MMTLSRILFLLLCLFMVRSGIAEPGPQDSILAIPDTPAGHMLSRWLHAHNSGSADSMKAWVHDVYVAPAASEKDQQARESFYLGGISMFGPLSITPLAIIRTSRDSLEVHLVRSDLEEKERLKPANIVVVEVITDQKRPGKLARGFLLASLICVIDEGAANNETPLELR